MDTPKPTEENLKVFGFGIAFIIPFFITLHVIKDYYQPSFGVFFIGFFVSIAAMLWFIGLSTKNHKVFVCAWAPVLLVGIVSVVQHWHWGQAMVLVISGMFYAVTQINYKRLTFIYEKWMIVAHAIGMTITAVALALLFYLIFAPIGLMLRLLKKDLLNEKIDRVIKSYWITRESQAFNKERYQQQF